MGLLEISTHSVTSSYLYYYCETNGKVELNELYFN